MDSYLKIQPSIYNAYHICKREAWLMYHQICGDQMNEFLYIGRLLSEDTFKRKKHEIVLADLPAKVDIIESRNGNMIIAEVKKSSRLIENGILQLKYYLYMLKKKGYIFKGEIKIPKEKISKKIELNDDDIKFIEKSLEEINEFLSLGIIPTPEKKTICTKCSHYEFCWV